jgi:hypothetical protein
MSFQNDEMPPQALAWLDAARDCDDPAHEDRARIAAAIAPKLAALGVVPAVFTPAPLAAAPALTGATAASAGGLGLGAKLAMVVVAASVAAGGPLYGIHSRERASAAPGAPAQAARGSQVGSQHAVAAAGNARVAQAVPSPAEARAAETPAVESMATAQRASEMRPAHRQRARFAAPLRATRARSVPASERTAPPAESAATSEPIDSSLREELALIARANTALRLEHPADALRALDEHARRFENGALGEERRGLRVLALCALSPNRAALDARDAFLRASPHALLAPKVRAACDQPRGGAR